jgi:hypothetical protein
MFYLLILNKYRFYIKDKTKRDDGCLRAKDTQYMGEERSDSKL